jgi:hypothetical protein
MLEFQNLFNNLPLELKIKIMYKSGLISNEAKIIKEFNETLYIKKKDWVYTGNQALPYSYIDHLVNIGELKREEIILRLNIYDFLDSDSDSD